VHAVKRGRFLAVVSEQPVLSVPAAKKAWLLLIVAAVGKVLNDHPKLGCKALAMSDVASAQQKRSYALPCSSTKIIQSKINTDNLSPEAAWALIEGALAELPIKDP
jgi:hypothetical protein